MRRVRGALICAAPTRARGGPHTPQQHTHLGLLRPGVASRGIRSFFFLFSPLFLSFFPPPFLPFFFCFPFFPCAPQTLESVAASRVVDARSRPAARSRSPLSVCAQHGGGIAGMDEGSLLHAATLRMRRLVMRRLVICSCLRCRRHSRCTFPRSHSSACTALSHTALTSTLAVSLSLSQPHCTHCRAYAPAPCTSFPAAVTFVTDMASSRRRAA